MYAIRSYYEEAGVPLPIPGDLFIAAAGFLAYRGQAAGPAIVSYNFV